MPHAAPLRELKALRGDLGAARLGSVIGEAMEAALLREVEEETGLQVRLMRSWAHPSGR